MHINIYKCIIINLINFVTATISFVLNVVGNFPDIQAPPQPCSIKNKTDSDNTTYNLIIMIICIRTTYIREFKLIFFAFKKIDHIVRIYIYIYIYIYINV